jgi:tRNA(fMet)-specific endonuclease VapC
MFLLDTNACIKVLNGSSAALVARLRREDPAAVLISSVTRAELLFGARNSTRVSETLKLLARFLAPLVSAPFDDRAAEHYGAIRAELASRGQPIGPNDLLIAATAKARDATLVTHNVREFSRVVGLAIEDWEREP